MQVIHQPAVADMFYPADPDTLQSWLQHHLPSEQKSNRAPRMLILPHAGYRFSGEIAAQGYKLLQPGEFKRVVIMCPAHRVYVRGIAVPTRWDAEATPLGKIPLDKEALQLLLTQPGFIAATEAHQQEHAIEVQLPFLQYQLGEFQLIPLVVGDCPPEDVCRALDLLMNDDTLAIVSTDLSHYLTQDLARQYDDATIQQILQFNGSLRGDQACGSYALNGALRWAQQQQLDITLLAKCTSGDTSSDKQRVVGYAAFALY
jgi:Predicted dioxygenase